MKPIQSHFHRWGFACLMVSFFFSPTQAQSIRSIAGGSMGDGGPATAASFNQPSGIAVDSDGNVVVTDSSLATLRRISKLGTISVYAGNGLAGFSGDGDDATAASLSFPAGVTFDSSGNLYIADTSNNRIRRVDRHGKMATVAGNGNAGYGGDGGPAISALLDRPTDVALDNSGNLFIADAGNNRIRRVDQAGIVTTFAGNGSAAFSGDGGQATMASLDTPMSVASDSSGDLYIADWANARIRRIDPGGTIMTVAGNGEPDQSGDGGPAVAASVGRVAALAVDMAGNLYLSGYDRVRKVDSSGSIRTVAGGGFGLRDGVPATETELRPSGLAVDHLGSVYIADTRFRIVRKLADGIITTYAGGIDSAGDGGPALDARFDFLTDVEEDGFGNLIILEDNYIRKIDGNGTISHLAGNGFSGPLGDGGLATQANISGSYGLAVDSLGNVYVADTFKHRIRKIDTQGVITTVAGNGVEGFSGDLGPASSANLSHPRDVAIDSRGNLFIADEGNLRIRKVDQSGIISTIAGNGTYGFDGDGGSALDASLDSPFTVAVDKEGMSLRPASMRSARWSAGSIQAVRFPASRATATSISPTQAMVDTPLTRRSTCQDGLQPIAPAICSSATG